jgi:hypothetical protein
MTASYQVKAPTVFPCELINKVLSYEGEHEMLNGELVRRVRKLSKDDERFNIVQKIQPWYGYHILNSEVNEYVISVSLCIGEEDDGDLYYNLRKIIKNDEYGLQWNTHLDVNVDWEYRRVYDIIKIEQNRIINNDEVMCIKPSTRDDYYYYNSEEEMENQEE